MATELQSVTVLHQQIRRIDPGAGVIDGLGVRKGCFQARHGGDVIGMNMGLDQVFERQTQVADQLRVALRLLDDAVDKHRLAAGFIGEQIGESAGFGVEELAE